MHTLDAIDRKILSQLRSDGRNTEKYSADMMVASEAEEA